jgi:hypothetical protein
MLSSRSLLKGKKMLRIFLVMLCCFLFLTTPVYASPEPTISQVFGRYSSDALQVARCESGLNPRAYNEASRATGMFQILPSTWNGTGFGPYSWSKATDPSTNIKAAYALFKRDGYSWREWTCKPWRRW